MSEEYTYEIVEEGKFILRSDGKKSAVDNLNPDYHAYLKSKQAE